MRAMRHPALRKFRSSNLCIRSGFIQFKHYELNAKQQTKMERDGRLALIKAGAAMVSNKSA
jgi:hypothetical protein